MNTAVDLLLSVGPFATPTRTTANEVSDPVPPLLELEVDDEDDELEDDELELDDELIPDPDEPPLPPTSFCIPPVPPALLPPIPAPPPDVELLEASVPPWSPPLGKVPVVPSAQAKRTIGVMTSAEKAQMVVEYGWRKNTAGPF